MKYKLRSVTLFCIFSLSCSMTHPALENKTYYSILPDNFIVKWQVKNDTICALTLNPQFQIRGGGSEDTSIIKIHKTIREGNSYNLYTEQLNDKHHKLRFGILVILRNKEGTYIGFNNNNSSFATLEECEQQKFKKPENDFCFSLYSQQSLDSFRQFRKLRDLDTATVCMFISKFKALYEANRTKMEKISKYDMYLSGSTKELMTRTLISMQIDPTDYTGDESNAMIKKCDNRIKH